jgi:tetratricopeptide (TPR) repeat protein
MSINSTVGRRMAKELEARPEKKFVRNILPWVIAAGGLVIYLTTLNHWVSIGNLERVARLARWTWQPELYSPLEWLVTYPLHWLPPRLLPISLNLFTAICAALTIALLARSVALLPHDRTHEQREKEHSPFALLTIKAAWLPPVLAAVVLGLQMTFWENATGTVSVGEMLNLLLFAYVIYSLLEFRLDQNESRLLRTSLVYGVAMTNNWAMIGFFPLFLVALVWIRGLAFFNINFLVKMLLVGLAGLSLYLLLPIVQAFTDVGSVPFWKALGANLGGQKYILGVLFSKYYLLRNDPPLWIIGIPSLLPILVVSIKWPSHFGDTSKLGIAIATITAHLVHAVFLVICVWIALDPHVNISPRYNFPGFSFLTLYYLGALSVGYFAGYFLLLFGTEASVSRRSPLFPLILNWSLNGLVWACLIISAATLLGKNFPQIKRANAGVLKQYASLLSTGLPKKGSIVFSDDAERLFLTEAITSELPNSKDFVFVHTGSLPESDYHRFLRKRYGSRWPLEFKKGPKYTVSEAGLIHVLLAIGQTNDLYYLHPSFGYYFEIFYPESHGLVYKLNYYPSNTLIAPLPSKAVIDENNAFWAKAETHTFPAVFAATAETNPQSDTNSFQLWMQFARLRKEPNRDAMVARAAYSRSLNYWGVELQKCGDLPKAANVFERVQQLNPANLVAKINLECNQNLQAGRKAESKSIEEIIGRYRSWDDVMSENGPFDQPKVCFEQGRIYARMGEYRQAANQFDRVRILDPENISARLGIAQMYVLTKMPEQALKTLDDIRAQTIPRTNETEFVVIETSARILAKDVNGAITAVQSALDKYPADETLVAAAAQVFINHSLFTNALELIDKQLKLSSDNLNALLNKGYVCLHLENYDSAIPPLTRVLTLETNVTAELHRTALLNRAIAYLRLGRAEESRRDYEALQKVTPSDPRIYYGLAELAYQAKDTNGAVRNYQLYLSNASTNTDEARHVFDRIKELKGAPP